MTNLTVFSGDRRIASGAPDDAGAAARAAIRLGEPVTIFDDTTGGVIDLDPDGRPVVPELQTAPRGPGRPKMGVISKEVTLLPRHWEWLSRQQGGASATLRRLVDAARRDAEGRPDTASVRERAYRVITVLGGDREGYEDAIRALFAGDRTGFDKAIGDWPEDVTGYVTALAEDGFE